MLFLPISVAHKPHLLLLVLTFYVHSLWNVIHVWRDKLNYKICDYTRLSLALGFSAFALCLKKLLSLSLLGTTHWKLVCSGIHSFFILTMTVIRLHVSASWCDSWLDGLGFRLLYARFEIFCFYGLWCH